MGRARQLGRTLNELRLASHRSMSLARSDIACGLRRDGRESACARRRASAVARLNTDTSFGSAGCDSARNAGPTLPAEFGATDSLTSPADFSAMTQWWARRLTRLRHPLLAEPESNLGGQAIARRNTHASQGWQTIAARQLDRFVGCHLSGSPPVTALALLDVNGGSPYNPHTRATALQYQPRQFRHRSGRLPRAVVTSR